MRYDNQARVINYEVFYILYNTYIYLVLKILYYCYLNLVRSRLLELIECYDLGISGLTRNQFIR